MENFIIGWVENYKMVVKCCLGEDVSFVDSKDLMFEVGEYFEWLSFW